MALNKYWQESELDWRPSSSIPANHVVGSAIFRPSRDPADTVLRIVAAGSCAAMTPTQYDSINPAPPVDAWPQLDPYLIATWSEGATPEVGNPTGAGFDILGISGFQRTMSLGTGTDLSYAVLFDQGEPFDVHSQRRSLAGISGGPTLAVYVYVNDIGLFFTDGISTFAARWRTGFKVRVLWGSLF